MSAGFSPGHLPAHPHTMKLDLILCAILLAAAVATRGIMFNAPAEVVFDEVHFGTFVRSYRTGENHFDIHAPLGKLLITGFARMGNAQLTQNFERISQPYPAHDLFWLRLFPLIAGVLLVLALYGFVRLLTGSPVAAFIASFLIALDSAFIIPSRLIVIDAPLIFFGILSLWCFLLQERARTAPAKIFLLVATGLAFGAAYSIKWAGMAAIVPLTLLAVYTAWEKKRWLIAIGKLLVIGAISFALYTSTFSVHFALLTKQGPGDAYLSPAFRQRGFAEKFIELNKKMYSYNAGITTPHAYASSWHQWLLNKKPIYYWQGTLTAEETAGQMQLRKEIWFIGNPIIWVMGLLGLCGSIIMMALILIKRAPCAYTWQILLLGIISWLVNLLPFMLIARPQFLYHYLTAYLFSLINFSYLLSCLLAPSPRSSPAALRMRAGLITALIMLTVGGVLFIAPITYGLPFSPEGPKGKSLSWLLK